MPNFSFTEKEWDKVRPASVKKTGVSEAMREVLKKVPKDLKALADGKACDDAVKLLDELDEAFSGAEGLVKKAKDDKHDAAGKLKAWRAEVKDGKKMVELQKDKIVYGVANKAAEVRVAEILKDVEAAVAEAQKLAAQVVVDLSAGKTVNIPELTKEQQNFRGTQRSARDVVMKSGFINAIKFLDEVAKAGLDPKKVEMPAVLTKKIEASIAALAKEVDALGEALEQATEKQSTVAGTSAIAIEARKLLDEYKASHKKMKAMGPEGKKLLASAKKANQIVRATKVADTSKLLAVVHQLHLASLEFEEMWLKESYRSRDSKGDLQIKLSAMTKKEDQGFDIKMNQPFRDWRAAIFDLVRLCTLPGGAAKDEIDDALEYVISLGGATAGQGESAAKRIAEERSALARKYGSTGGG